MVEILFLALLLLRVVAVEGTKMLQVQMAALVAEVEQTQQVALVIHHL
jgi:hypothetical protein